MILTLADIKRLSRALDEARRTFDCPAARRDAYGRSADPSGLRPYGTHGSAFIGIDPSSGLVVCLACRSEEPTARAKNQVTIGRRIHKVSLENDYFGE